MSSDNKDNTSTLQSIYDNTVGVIQSAVGSLTGNQADQVCILKIPSKTGAQMKEKKVADFLSLSGSGSRKAEGGPS